jgi:hypothetical protein
MQPSTDAQFVGSPPALPAVMAFFQARPPTVCQDGYDES